MSNEDDETIIPAHELTFMENYVWAWLGYFFCEVAFRSPDFAWEYLHYPSWCHSLGGWFYCLAFDRWWREHENEAWK